MTEIKLPYQRQMNKKIRKPLKPLPTPNLKPFRCFVPLLACSKTSPNPFEAPKKKIQHSQKSRLGPPSKKNNVSFRNQWQSFQSPVHSFLPQGFRSWINLGEGFCVLKPGRPFRLKPSSRTLKWHESPAFIHKNLTTESCHRHGQKSTHFLSAWDNGKRRMLDTVRVQGLSP